MTLFEGALFTRELMLGDLTAQERDELVQFMAENAPMYGIDPRSVPQTYDQYVCCVLARAVPSDEQAQFQVGGASFPPAFTRVRTGFWSAT